MLAQLTAVDVLVLVLVVGSISALFGWAGGAGARLLFAIRLDRIEGAVMTILNRAKGAAGGATAQLQKARLTSAEKEAEELAAKLRAAPRARRNAWGLPVRTAADAAEAASLAEIEARQEEARKAKGS